MKKRKRSAQFDVWIEARQRFHLSDAQVQMARELGLNPTKFGKLANHKQEPWKAPLPEFIESLYLKRFGKTAPDNVVSVEHSRQEQARKQEAKRQRKLARRAANKPDSTRSD